MARQYLLFDWCTIPLSGSPAPEDVCTTLQEEYSSTILSMAISMALVSWLEIALGNTFFPFICLKIQHLDSLDLYLVTLETQIGKHLVIFVLVYQFFIINNVPNLHSFFGK